MGNWFSAKQKAVKKELTALQELEEREAQRKAAAVQQMNSYRNMANQMNQSYANQSGSYGGQSGSYGGQSGSYIGQSGLYGSTATSNLSGARIYGTNPPYSSSTIWSSTTSTTATLNPVKEHKVSRYVMTEEGMENLVNGKLKLEKVPSNPDVAEENRTDFIIHYDSLQVSLLPLKFRFLYKGTVIFEISGADYALGRDDTLTMQNLEGRIPFTITR